MNCILKHVPLSRFTTYLVVCIIISVTLTVISPSYAVSMGNSTNTTATAIDSNASSYNPSHTVTMYVAPRNELPVRTGKGFNYRIIAILTDGARVQVITTDGDWAYIRLRNGKEGWTLKRFLSSKLPLKQQFNALKLKNSELQKKLSDALKMVATLKTQVANLTTQNQSLTSKLKDISNKYQQLYHDSSNVITLKNAYENTQKELQQAKQIILTIETENSHLKSTDRIKWFLAGAGVLLIGCLIGILIAKGRRKRSSLTLG